MTTASDLGLTDQDFSDVAPPTDGQRERRGPGRPRKHPLGRTFNAPLPRPMLSASPAASVELDIQSPHDRFLCRPYGTMLTASGCVRRQAERRATIGQVPTHLRFCAGCKLGEAVAARVSAAESGDAPVAIAQPSADVAAGEASAAPDGAVDVPETPTRPEGTEAPPVIHRPLPACGVVIHPTSVLPLVDVPTDLAALEARLNARVLSVAVQILESIDALRAQVVESIALAREANERVVRQVGAHVAVGRPSIVAEQVVELLRPEPTEFRDLIAKSGMRRDVLKAALARLQRQGRAESTTTGWRRTDDAARDAAGGDTTCGS